MLHIKLQREEDGSYVVSAPALKGCWSQGETREEALSNIEEAIQGWLEAEDARVIAEFSESEREGLISRELVLVA